MELHTQYTFSGTTPLNFREDSTGLDLTYTLYYEAVCSVAPADGAAGVSDELTEDALRKAVERTVPVAYFASYPDGMTGLPAREPEEKVQKKALEKFTYALCPYNAVPERFEITRQWLSEENEKEWDGMMKAARVLTPDRVAQYLYVRQADMIRAAQAAANMHAAASAAQTEEQAPAARTEKIRWVCACGKINDMNFCPECGRKRSAEKWICSCGSENSSRFCPECGRAFE